MPSSVISFKEVQKHSKSDDCWIIIRGIVYNVTDFLNEHPGGAKMILKYAGKDATAEYEPIHPENALQALPKNATVGALDPDAIEQVVAPPPANAPLDTTLKTKKPKLSPCLSLEDIENAAEKILTPRAFAYFKGGADNEWSLRWNERVFEHIRFRPRVLVDISKYSLATTVMGQPASLPILVAPAAMAKQAHPDGELALGRAAAKYGIPLVSCMNASYGYEVMVKNKDPKQVFFYQVYIHRDRSITEKDIRRVKELGYKGIMVTVDAPVIGKRERDERVNAALDDDEEAGGSYSKAVPNTKGLAKSTSSYIDSRLVWKDIQWIRSIVGVDMPITVKGIQTAEDAAICATMGFNIYISNHGARQLNSAPTSVEVLLEVRKHCPWVFDLVEVYVDSGYRRGSDIIKALALGARAVLLGRPFLFSLAFGQEGVEKTIDILADEMQIAMRLLGVTSVDQLRPYHVNAKELENNVSDHYLGLSKPWLSSRSLKARL